MKYIVHPLYKVSTPAS